jgi:signal transduction histidine kinase
MGSKIRQAGIRVELNIPMQIELDSYPGSIDQIICNLVDNALLHGLHGQANGKISIAANMTEAGLVAISVSDNGAGIAAENLLRIFDPFFTTKLGRGGTGLGLNIVYNIVTKLLGGKITVHSEAGKGVNFTFTLPVIAPATDAT